MIVVCRISKTIEGLCTVVSIKRYNRLNCYAKREHECESLFFKKRWDSM